MVALALPGMFFPVSLWAQDTADKAPAYNRLSVGLKAMHLYDLRFNSYDDLQNGFSGEDMFGLNGQKTRFDMAFGLEAAYQFSPVLSVDVYGAMGNMTGANQIEYYKAKTNFIGAGANIALKTAATGHYRFIPYARFSTGWAGYSSTRYFIQDDVDFSTFEGNTLHYGLGLGLRAYLLNNLAVYAQSQFVVVATDAWDGYNYGSGKDHMLQTAVGIRYTIGPKERKSLETAPAWQGKTDPDLLTQQALMKEQLEQLNGKVANVEQQTKNNQLAIDSLEADLLAKTNPETLNKQIEEQVKKLSAALASGNLHVVYFAFNKADIDEQGRTVLTQLVNHLNRYPQLKIGISAFNDEVGNAQVNELIRDARRDAVRSYLLGAGIAAERMLFEPWTGIYTGNDRIDRRAEIRLLP